MAIAASNFNTADKVNRGGDQMSGPLLLSADPKNPLEAATKQYVDSLRSLSASVTYADDFMRDAQLGSPSRFGFNGYRSSRSVSRVRARQLNCNARTPTSNAHTPSASRRTKR